MSETATPAVAPAFSYVVISPFPGYAKGDIISTAAAIAVVEKDYLPHVVRIRAHA